MPIVAVMIAVDVIANITIFVFLFVDLPYELLVTQRLDRYRNDSKYSSSWRNKVAAVICTQALNPFDPTKHHC